jgi:hypothetical protein
MTEAGSQLLADPRQEAIQVVGAANAADLALRVTGGVAVSLICTSATRPPLARPVKDLDLVGRSKERKKIEAVLAQRGYVAEERFNLLQGDTQLMFVDPVNERQVDVFLDQLNMCHTLEFGDRLRLHDLTLEPTDLLLSKLQIVEATERDLRDIAAILIDCEVDTARIEALVGNDWGWWRTVLGTLDSLEAFLAETPVEGSERGIAQADEIRRVADEAPKSVKWRMRARIGERKRWYELPEDTR